MKCTHSNLTRVYHPPGEPDYLCKDCQRYVSASSQKTKAELRQLEIDYLNNQLILVRKHRWPAELINALESIRNLLQEI